MLVSAVHTAVDGNEPHVILWECDLGIHPNFQIISADAAHVLRDDRADLSVFHQCHHALPIRSLKVCACVTVIYKELRIAEAVFLCISAEIGFLIHNAVTVALRFIVTGQAAIQRGNFVRLLHSRFLHHLRTVCQDKVAVGHDHTLPSESISFTAFSVRVCFPSKLAVKR